MQLTSISHRGILRRGSHEHISLAWTVADHCGRSVCLCSDAGEPARASLIINGGFEAGFAGWTSADQLGSDGTFFLQSGTTSPSNGDPVPAPPEGISAAMTDAQGPGPRRAVPGFRHPFVPSATAQLRFDLFIGNRATDFFTPSPASLDFSTPALNEQARVDILIAGTDPFSVSSSDVLLNVYQTRPGDPLVSGYSTIIADLTSLLAANTGSTLRLRFAETDNVFVFQLGVDNVELTANAVPEPSTLALWSLLNVVVGFVAWQRCKAV